MAAEYCVLAFDTLKPARPDGEAVALALLKQAAWQVQPIMKRRQWRILMLRELEPENLTRGGDNLNRGEQVRIKVRRPEGGHYSLEHVLHVLLHELCHNQFGPHSASFYGLLDDITVECEALMAKKQGGTGAGFDAHGEKLGHRGGWGAQPGDPRAAAREAALKRAKQQGVMGGGGRRVGGGFSEGAAAGLTPQQAAAAAAQRRLAAQQFSRDAGLEDDVQEEGGKAVEPLQLPPAQVLPRLRLGGPCICGACDGKPGACPRGPLALRGGADAPIELLNSDSDEREGGAAEAGRPKRPALAPSRRRPCAACASARGCACWSCGACTRRNTGGSSHCDSCATWRYSRDGPPAP